LTIATGQTFSNLPAMSYPSLMAIENILAQIDSEIARLQQARSLLANIGTASTKATRKAVKKAAAVKPARKRKISAEGRKRIAEAQRKRWAAQRAKAKQKKA
jgi:translation initiation factor 2 gamma subunit (eIF-2gamma)